MDKAAAPHVAPIFFNIWVIPYDILDYLLSEKGAHFVSKFILSFCVFLGVKKPCTTAYL